MQLVLLLLALVSVPWMLIPKPLLLKRQHERVCLYSISHILLLLCACSLIFSYCFSVYFQSEASGPPIRNAPGHRWISGSGVGGTSWRLTWPWGVWVQRSFCSPNDPHDWICSWCSLKHSFIPSSLGSEVMLLIQYLKCTIAHSPSHDFYVIFSLHWLVTSNWYIPCSLAHSELSSVFYDKVLLMAWG